MREVSECRHCRGPVKRADLHSHEGDRNDCYATWTCVNPNCRSSSDIAAMVCPGGDNEAVDEPVGFAPGRYVRLKNDMAGLPAGTRGMISGRVLTRPEDDGKLEVVFRAYIPGSPEYGDLEVLPEALEWDLHPRRER